MVNRILGIIGWIGTVLVFAAVAVRFLRPEWNQYATWAAWAGLVCVLLYMTTMWRDVVSFYGTRQARYGTVTLVGVLVALGIVVAANYLAVRQSKRWDLTENQLYTLSDQSVQIVQKLDAPVKFTVYDKEDQFERFRDRLRLYEYHSDKVTSEYVDVDKNPARARAAEVQAYGTVILEYKDRVERLSNVEEQDITNALIKAVTGTQKKVYFTQGHGERDTAGSDRAGYSTIVASLGRDNYGVERIVLAQQAEVPADATVVVAAGPRTDFLPLEIEALKRYVVKGGKVLFLVDPGEPGETAAPLPNITGFLKEWGIDVGNDVVLDASGIGRMFQAGPEVPVAVDYPQHPITERLGGVMTVFPLARSVSAATGGTSGKTAQPLVQTRPQSWAEADLKSLSGGGPVAFNAEGGDRQGPISLAAAVSAPATDVATPPAGNATPDSPTDQPKPESRVVAIGDSDFAANGYLGFQGNQDFLLNTVSWLAQQENLIAIRPRQPQDRRITMTADQLQRIMWLSLLIVPGVVLASGAYAWWRRR